MLNNILGLPKSQSSNLVLSNQNTPNYRKSAITHEALNCILTQLSTLPTVAKEINSNCPQNIKSWVVLVGIFNEVKTYIENEYKSDCLNRFLKTFNGFSSVVTDNSRTVLNALSKMNVVHNGNQTNNQFEQDCADWWLCCCCLHLLPYIHLQGMANKEQENQINTLLYVSHLQLKNLPDTLLWLSFSKNKTENVFSDWDIDVINHIYAANMNQVERILN